MAGLELFFFYLFGASAPLSLAALNVAQGGLALFFLARAIRGRCRLGLPEWLLVAFIAWNCVSALSGPMPSASLRGVLNFWSWSALFLAVSLPAAVLRRLRTFTAFLGLSAALTLPISACTFFLGTNFHLHHLTSRVPVGVMNAFGFFSHHLTYAGVMLAAAALVSGRALYGPSSEGRAAWWSAAAACGANLVMSLARSYFVAAIPTAVVLLWKKGRRWVLWGLVALALAGGLMVAVGPRSLRKRVVSSWDMTNASNAERIYLWAAGAKMVADHPILGWGPGIYEETAGPYKAPYAGRIHYPTHEGFQTTSHAHNLYLMIAIQCGLPGLALFLVFCVTAMKRVWAQPDPALRYGAAAAFTAFLVGGFFEFNGGDAEVATLVFFLLGLGLAQASSPGEGAPSDPVEGDRARSRE